MTSLTKKELLLILMVCVIGVVYTYMSAAQATGTPEKTTPAPVVTAQVAITTADGKEAGTAEFTQTQQGVLLDLEVKNLSPGEHAFHIHEKGDCTPATAGKDAFTNAGAHLNTKGNPHGYAAHGSHEGDMPNIFVNKDGTAKLHVLNTRITLDPNDTSARGLLRDTDGAALVIHASPDDYTTQPSGNAGDRIACGVIN